MLDINKLRAAYNVVHRLSQNKNPLAEEELTLAVVQSAQVQEALVTAAETIAAYGKIMNIMAQSTSFSVAKTGKEQFSIAEEEIAALKPAAEALQISYIARYINENIASIADNKMKKLSAASLGRWLVSCGYLQMDENGKNKVATDKGVALGIHTEKRVSQYNGDSYNANFYSPEAQQFIFNSLPAVAEFLAQEKAEKNAAAQGKSAEADN